MFTESRVRALSALGAVVSLLIGIGTIGGAIASSFSEAIPLALQIVGGASHIVLAVSAVCLTGLLLKGRDWRTAAVFAVVSAVLLRWGASDVPAALNGSQDAREFLLISGLGFAGAAALLTVLWFRGTVREHQASVRGCPDCAETIKAAANVCRYCGYRIAPAPSEPAADASETQLPQLDAREEGAAVHQPASPDD